MCSKSAQFLRAFGPQNHKTFDESQTNNLEFCGLLGGVYLRKFFLMSCFALFPVLSKCSEQCFARPQFNMKKNCLPQVAYHFDKP